MASKMAADFAICHISGLNHHRNVNKESKHMFLGARNSILPTFYYLNPSLYNLIEYPTFEDTENGSSVILKSLKLFLYKLLDPKGKKSVVVTRRCTTIAHSVIATCRPRSFISPLLLAISVYLHRKYAFREMIDILSSISFVDDYKEVKRLEWHDICW